MTLTDKGTIARDLQSAADTWRPQRFSETGGDVRDPLIEPLWTGLRVLAVVDATAATFRDIDGDPVDEFAEVATELAAASRAERFIVDGYLTHQVLQEPAAIARRDATEKSTSSPTMSQLWFGNLLRRRNRNRQPVQVAERVAPAAEEDVALVVVDIVWLDDEPLLDVPLLERKRILESALGESRLVRRSTFVRPPVDPWLGSWRSFGFSRMAYKAANSRYLPGQTNPQWTVADVPAR